MLVLHTQSSRCLCATLSNATIRSSATSTVRLAGCFLVKLKAMSAMIVDCAANVDCFPRRPCWATEKECVSVLRTAGDFMVFLPLATVAFWTYRRTDVMVVGVLIGEFVDDQVRVKVGRDGEPDANWWASYADLCRFGPQQAAIDATCLFDGRISRRRIAISNIHQAINFVDTCIFH